MMISTFKHRPLIIFIALLTLIAIGGFALVWYSTVWGAGLISDSFQYIASAKSLASRATLGYPTEDSLLIPMTQYPPLFSILLAGIQCIGIDPLNGARLLNALLLGANIVLVAASVHHISGSYGFSLLGGLLAMCSASLVEAHSWVLSEPLYIFLSLAAFLFLAKHLEHSKRCWLVTSAGFAGLAFLTRYVGLSLVITGICAVLLQLHTPHNPREKGDKVGNLALFAANSLIPMLLWTCRNYLLTNTLNNRSLQWIPLTPKNLLSAANALLAWFLPSPLVTGHEKIITVILALILLFILSFLFLSKKPTNVINLQSFTRRIRPLSFLHGIYFFLYFLMVIVSKTLFDQNIGLTDRMLLPMQVSMIILLASALCALWKSNHLALRLVVAGMSVYITGYYAAGAAVAIPRFHNQGLGVARKGWHNSETVQALQDFASLPIYSNSPSSLYLWTDRPGYGVLDFEQMRNSGAQGQAILVVFNHIPKNSRIERITQGLPLYKSDKIASIYLYPP